MSYEAFVLTDKSRNVLLKLFPPTYSTWIGDHVTHDFGCSKRIHCPYGLYTTSDFELLAYYLHDGVEVFTVAARGKTTRPDGRLYHLTWSIDQTKGRKPFDSNMIIASHQPTKTFETPISFEATFDYVQ